jgi:ureidoglycolate dehydrogenase (NAD+)
MADLCVAAAPLQSFMTDVFAALGMPPADAALEAQVLVWANLRGIDSHGVQRVAEYAGQIDAGNVNPKPTLGVLRETPAVAYIDGDWALGPIVTVFAARKVMEKARATGIGWALIRNTMHQGAMGYYTEMIAEAGLAGIAIVSNRPNMAPTGARGAGVHNSPISIAVPRRGGPPLDLDMATSVAAFGKIQVAMDAGAPIPADWGVDAEGEPTTEPHRVRALRPAGTYKGYGLALMFECLTSMMAANPLLMPAPAGSQIRPGSQNSVVAAIDISLFTDAEAYAAQIDALVGVMHRLPLAAGAEEVLVPGEREDRVRRQRLATGIPLPAGTVAKLQQAGRRFGIPLPAALE